jgi:hypothetical protein
MGASIHILVEYDDAHLYEVGPLEREPFSTPPSAIDFFNYTRLRSGKDTRFFAALGWTTEATRREALFSFRGLPPNLSPEAESHFDQFFDPSSYGLGWLTREEVKAAIEHQGYTRDDLSLAVNVVLEAIDFLGQQLGPGRVRLVFGFS